MSYWLLSIALFLCFPSGSVDGKPVAHVIPHSHCDAGYRKTFGDYFQSEVKYILDTVTEQLRNDSKKRFVWEEVSFLSEWWQQASEDQKALVKSLQKSGQLEFIGGGWVMHDEAVTSAFSVLNQMSLGLKFLQEEIGVRPQIEWHIDPFGHSISMPEWYTKLGYKAVVLNRIPNHIKQEMKRSKGLEFFWKSPYSNESIFAHVLEQHYSTPAIFGLDTEEKAKYFADEMFKRLEWFKTDHLLVPFGNDFSFQNAESEFREMDKIIAYINSNMDIQVRYSTLSEYFEAVLDSGVEFNHRGDDFFPYIHCALCGSADCGFIDGIKEGNPCGFPWTKDSYWSGFYTSKPSQKLLVRKQEADLKAFETLNALYPYTSADPGLSSALALNKNTSALLQHHDAITGTSFPECYDDYNWRLGNASDIANTSTAQLKVAALCGTKAVQGLQLSSNATDLLQYLGASNDSVVATIVQNPLGSERYSYIKVPLTNSSMNIEVLLANGSRLESQVVGSTLFFPLYLPAWGLEVVFLKAVDVRKNNAYRATGKASAGLSLDNGAIQLQFNAANHLTEWTVLSSNTTHTTDYNYVQYYEEVGIIPDQVCDGTNVYTFVPKEPGVVLTIGEIPTRVTAEGPLVWELEQEIPQQSLAHTAIRMYKPFSKGKSGGKIETDWYGEFAEFEIKVTPTGLSADSPSSVGALLSTDLKTSNKLITYASGFYPLERTYNTTASLQSNTYPLVGRVLLPDHSLETVLALISQRPMGTAASSGTLEFTLHRRIKLAFDPRGDDHIPVRSSVLVGFISQDSAPVLTAQAMLELQNPPTLHYALLHSVEEWTMRCRTLWSPVSKALPTGVHMLSFELLSYDPSADTSQVGMRLMSTEENLSLSVDISSFLASWTVSAVSETTPDFLVVTNAHPCASQVHFQGDGVICSIKLDPLQLRSFVVTYMLNTIYH